MQIDEERLNNNWKGVRSRLVDVHRASHLPLFANFGNERQNPEFIGSSVTAAIDRGRVKRA